MVGVSRCIDPYALPSFSIGSWSMSPSDTYTMPCTLNDTSFELAPQFSLPKQYMYFPSDFALKEKSPLETAFSYVSYWPTGFVICGARQSVRVL